MVQNITYEMYNTNKCCAEATENLTRIIGILTQPSGNFFFDSLIITCNFEMMAKELR
jgi:hypothetical protein